ncbi:hypothetical protein BG015_007188 [Linnemannia schmuckeri]|uniref:Uncharacterized protein n=1 Tax=Linnemannia schmuckeri TaxID=64567 RepID=A0A9P5VBL7_9FUNG|nr:hypothetical protein BG015_007188 [Linnemannia schmuckeri]
MGISIDTQEGGPIEGIFGSQVEQRLAHHIDHEDDDFGHARRPSESNRDINNNSIQCNTDLGRGFSPSSYRLTAPSPLPPGSKSWLRLPWNPWRHESPSMPHAHRPIPSPHPKHTSSWWWPAGFYDRLPLGMSLNRATGGGSSGYITELVAAVVSSKRRKGWFLGLILVSLALTILSGGYLMSQFQHHKDITPPVISVSNGEESSSNHGHQPNTPITDLEQDSGPRKDRDRSKKPHGPAKKKPTKSAGATTTGGNRPQDAGSSSLRICNLQDVAKGQWVFSQATSTHSAAPRADQDLSWTGYGPFGCRSTIWNERYLLTPGVVPESESSAAASSPHLSKDWVYADRLQQYHWLIENSSPKHNQKTQQDQQQKPKCRQPDMDLADFVEVLKRSPLVMIGDKFLEQEFLTLECMLMGMQQQLLIDYRVEDNGNRGSQAELEALDYWIDSEKPAVTELKVASSEKLLSLESPSGGSAEALKSRPMVYRKAKPGLMKLIERQSNLTLITFIRSDVLWDTGMLTGTANKHALKSVEELAMLDTGGLHPDCKLAGSTLMCEPAGIDRHDSESRGTDSTQPSQQSASRWWKWLVGSEETSLNDLSGHNVAEFTDEEMATGSDLDHDVINLEWVDTLKDMVEESAKLRQRRKWGAPEVERKPMVLVSNGQFWEYDPRDAVRFDLQGGERKLSKVEQNKIKESQDRRRSMLRQRYTIVLTNMLDYIKTTYPDLRVMVQTSVKRSPCESAAVSADDKALWKLKDQEAALLNALTKTVVARMQDPLYSFLDTTFLRIFKDSTPNKRHCRSFMMPGPLDTLVKFLYGELYRLDL